MLFIYRSDPAGDAKIVIHRKALFPVYRSGLAGDTKTVINSQVLFLIYWSLIKRTYTFYKITKTLGEEKENKCSDKTNLPWMTGVVIVEP